MTVLDGALLAGAALVLLGYLLVVLAGFRREFIWGVINLVPVVSLAFVLLHWHRARTGFLVSVMGLLVLGGALHGGADRTVEQTLERFGVGVDIQMPVTRPWDVELPNQALVRRIEEETGQPLEIVEYDPFAPVQPLPPASSFRLEADPAPAPRAYRMVLPAELPQLEGARMRLVLGDGVVREGNLIAVTPTSLYLQQVILGGHVAFEYRRRDIRRMEVWDRMGAAPRVPPSAEVQSLPDEPDVIFEAD
ncbi:hypothetical protein [Ectothiorhodospira lacustris]|uniref:hypothetical protein n=1 Tax=Ectothiorhodospira lacustris TaxID=2899127 RepID=UPI001EE964EB|nr:hypothetical protein [Ectothiorhodospira lacustris]MCG5501636.1 hypothetical protein [Ectothiorhodospira lacustris]MCG5510738.1 hypothetical protein [Ectothiorhodospira lacustris]MCG5522470.1 hypothetical protein [Ectothiorhodospira lacustris]